MVADHQGRDCRSEIRCTLRIRGTPHKRAGRSLEVDAREQRWRNFDPSVLAISAKETTRPSLTIWTVAISLLACNWLVHCEEPLRFFDLRNFGSRVEANQRRNEHFAGDLIATGRCIELCK
jgi:hypothetical protein